MKLWFVRNKDKKPGNLLPGLQKDVKSQLPNIGKSLPNIGQSLQNIGKSIDLNVIMKVLMDYAKQIQKDFNTPPSPERRMKYPYTLSAKIAQFPYMHFYKNNWIARYYPYGVLACIPVFWYCSRLVLPRFLDFLEGTYVFYLMCYIGCNSLGINMNSNSPANKATWREIRRREREEAHHRFD